MITPDQIRTTIRDLPEARTVNAVLPRIGRYITRKQLESYPDPDALTKQAEDAVRARLWHELYGDVLRRVQELRVRALCSTEFPDLELSAAFDALIEDLTMKTDEPIGVLHVNGEYVADILDVRLAENGE